MAQQQGVVLGLAQRRGLVGRHAASRPERRCDGLQQAVLLAKATQAAAQHVPAFVVFGMAFHAPARLGYPAFAARNCLGQVLFAHGVPVQFRQPDGEDVESCAATRESRITFERSGQHRVPPRGRQHHRFGQDVAQFGWEPGRQALQGFEQGLGVPQRAHAPAGGCERCVKPAALVAQRARGKGQCRAGAAQGLACLVDAVVTGFAFTPQLRGCTGKLVERVGTQVAAQTLALGHSAHFRGLGHGQSLLQGITPA